MSEHFKKIDKLSDELSAFCVDNEVDLVITVFDGKSQHFGSYTSVPREKQIMLLKLNLALLEKDELEEKIEKQVLTNESEVTH